MKLHVKKNERCPVHDVEGILIVDAESEKHPRKDEHGNILYYCPHGPHIFAVPPGDGPKTNGTAQPATVAGRP